MSPSTSHSAVAPRVEVITVGDELLAGDLVDTNTNVLGQRCRAEGLVLARALTVRDRVPEIVAAVRSVASVADVCLVSGGLGPTTDDLTAQAMAEAAGVSLRRDAGALERLEAKFRAFGRPMPEANKKQADFPEGATILANPIGSAEGFSLRLGDCVVFCMPGVPRELKLMVDQQVMPVVRERFEVRPVPRRVYRLLGMGESSVAKKVEPIIAAARERSAGLAALFVHYRASMPEVTIGLEATPSADGEQATEDELKSFDSAFSDVLAPALYGLGTARLPPRLLAVLREHGLWIATAESCTGGAVAAQLAAIPGASQALRGSIVAYDNAVKVAQLGVPQSMLEEHGAVSEPVARAMAAGVREALKSDLSVAITGIAGPSGGTPEKPVGTVHIAVSDDSGTTHKQLKLRGSRGTVQRSAALWAIKLAWDRMRERGLATTFALDDESPA